MKNYPLLFVGLFVFMVACSDDSENSSNTNINLAADPTLILTDGTEISSEALRCIYRQNTGADDGLSLQLQYLAAPNRVSFALYFDDPIPSSPFSAIAGQQGRISFEVFTEGVSYQGELSNSEIEVRLNTLPSPSALSDGDTITLNGSLLISQFSLMERSATGVVGSRVLELASGSVEIDCETVFDLAIVVN